MIELSYIKAGDGIGITAPSDGNRRDTDFARLEHAIQNMQAHQLLVKETRDVRTSEKGASAEATARAEEFMSLVVNPDIQWMICAKGGDFLVEILPLLDWDRIRNYPKWIQGYSDSTGILYPITTLLDWPTVYASNFSDFGMKNWHVSLEENLEILQGKRIVQESFPYYESQFVERVTGLEEYSLTEPVRLQLLSNPTQDNLSDSSRATGDFAVCKGRLLGGCMDVLLNLIGTPFDGTREFIKRYKEDGILWYLETFALPAERVITGLWQMKQAGWFEGASGFLFGRPCFFSSDYEISFEEAVVRILGDLKVPIVTGADIGHRAPRWTMVNGWRAKFSYEDGKGRLQYELDGTSENRESS